MLDLSVASFRCCDESNHLDSVSDRLLVQRDTPISDSQVAFAVS